MAVNYRSFMKLLEKWPIDSSKRGRDLGQHIREELKKTFRSGEVQGVDGDKCMQVHASLKRLSENHYGQLYKRTLTSSATGLSAQNCHDLLSSEFLEVVAQEENEGFFQKLFKKGLCSYFYEGFHTPVMVKEVLGSLQPKEGQVFIDMTFGSGGHTYHLLSSTENTKVFALDRDPVAYSLAQRFAEKFPNRVIPLLGKFSDLPSLLKQHKVKPNSIDGILFDSGCSSMQFDTPERGFSLSKDGPLDMRMDGYRIPDSITAADVLARAEEYDLVKILKVYGEEKQCKKIARAIVEARYTFHRLETTKELADLVAAVTSTEMRLDKLQRPSHAATKTFQALRIFVNNEVNELNYGVLLAHRYMKLGGTLVSLSFHSLEDRIFKRHLSGNVIDNAINPLPLKYADHSVWHDEDSMISLMSSNWMPLYKHVLLPDSEEVVSNPRSRSAKLRAAVKVQ